MKFVITAFSLFVVFSLNMLAQKYHTPVEVIKTCADSKIHYKVLQMTAEELATDTTDYPLIQHGIYISKENDGQYKLKNYEEDYNSDKDIKSMYEQAEASFIKRDWSTARGNYIKVLDKMPYNSQVMTYVGQSYESEKKFDKCNEWYTKAIKSNYYDYMAHWFYSSANSRLGNKDLAVSEIILAHILNRNNPRLYKEMVDILKEAGMKFNNDNFNVNYLINMDSIGHVNFKYDSSEAASLIFSMCKALWAYEPDYAKSTIGSSSNFPELIEEKECYLVAVIGYNNSKENGKNKTSKINPKYEKIQKIIMDENLDYMVLYEVILKKDPYKVFYMTNEAIEGIADYLKKYRIVKLISNE